MRYGLVVVGPPGSGKTTLCRAFGAARKTIYVNLDPGNERSDADVDVRELATTADAQAGASLGPNGALSYCLALLEVNVDWLLHKLDAAAPSDSDAIFVFDAPGQVELWTHETSLFGVLHALRKHEFHLGAINVLDGFVARGDVELFVSYSLCSLHAMLRLGLPHLNVLTKMDLCDGYEDDSEDVIEEAMYDSRVSGLTRKIATVLCEYSLVGYARVDIKDGASLAQLCVQTDSLLGIARPTESQT